MLMPPDLRGRPTERLRLRLIRRPPQSSPATRIPIARDERRTAVFRGRPTLRGRPGFRLRLPAALRGRPTGRFRLVRRPATVAPRALRDFLTVRLRPPTSSPRPTKPSKEPTVFATVDKGPRPRLEEARDDLRDDIRDILRGAPYPSAFFCE